MKSYPDSVRFLYSLGNEMKTVKFGLDAIAAVLAELDHPERACSYVHVAGTNGKGSTCAMIASGLRSGGIRTGLYTSPHLVEPTERIQIDGVAVSKEQFSDAFDLVHAASERLIARGKLEHHPTYFETVTAMAFVLFREARVETTVLEVGLGGRLDATNVIHPKLAVITPVDFDHEKFLGNTIAAIAWEKAGILKPGVELILGRQRAEAESVIRARAVELGCAVWRMVDHPPTSVSIHARGSEIEWEGIPLTCPLPGVHQIDNAITAALALRRLGMPDDAISRGIAAASWPGRLEYISSQPDIILDGAHNPSGARALASYIEQFFAGRRVWLIYGTMRDKSIGEILETLFPLAGELILTRPNSPRALDPSSLLRVSHHPRARVCENLRAALDLVRAEAKPEDAVFISGSLFLVGEARALLLK
ncbi:MAG: bifunctional folylpolyglutamate synthase/dihydrofolate synthase [Bryobacteraceae bacterium]|nr:bifunctional folylpolyglutamate synthase/dihydrofolate synthase [Bryobacteraceae bacterium]MDW8379372.1 folylpolyglutamate synthase/dihydrofolate synthase family protein [Bryobacterales bacterium]